MGEVVETKGRDLVDRVDLLHVLGDVIEEGKGELTQETSSL